MSYSKYEVKSVIVSMFIAGGLATIFLLKVALPLMERTPEEQEFCMQPNVICESTSPFFLIATLVVGLGSYVLLVWLFDRVWEKYHVVDINDRRTDQ